MRAVICKSFDGPEALAVGELDDPTPGAGEIVIEVAAASVSFMDSLLVSGGYQMRPALPFAPGTDAAGRVVAVGSGVDEFSVGDRVVGSAWYGAYAERMLLRQERCVRLPANVPDDVASTIPYAYITAHHALVGRAALRPGEVALVTGATGGVGLAALDVAAMCGARVIAIVGHAGKADLAREYGAEAVIDLSRQDLREEVRALTEGKGVDVAFDSLGGETFLTLGRVMAPGGRLMPIGFASGEIPALPMNLPLLKEYSVVGVFMGAWADREPAAAKASLAAVVERVAEGHLRPRVDRVLPLAEAAAAMALIAERSVRGRVVLEVGPDRA